MSPTRGSLGEADSTTEAVCVSHPGVFVGKKVGVTGAGVGEAGSGEGVEVHAAAVSNRITVMNIERVNLCFLISMQLNIVVHHLCGLVRILEEPDTYQNVPGHTQQTAHHRQDHRDIGQSSHK